jgi:molecular chaperone HtpG
MTGQIKKFDAEVGKILQLMIHSLYTEKEIFVRELISNASDACDKLRYLAQTDSKLVEDDAVFKISVSVDKEKNTLIIRDNGIGMSKQELGDNLGTIAKSGTQNFLNQLSGDSKKDSMLIGQFGVGFYSSFMVADYVTVTSKKAGEDKVYTWYSDGQGEYTISDTDRDFSRGTEIALRIKEEDNVYLDHFRVKHIIKSYSDHVSVPIFFAGEDGVEHQLNSSSAIWKRSKSEVTEEQHQEFYKSVAHSPDNPWLTIHNHNEGALEFTNLLYIPSTKTFDLFHPDRKCRVKLYIKRVFIGDENIDLIPQYLRFLRGVVDSEDLPLNISRQTLQNNATLTKIKTSITKKVLTELAKKKDSSREEYLAFWNNFGAVVKEGLCEVVSDHEKLLDVCVFRSAIHNKMISLDEYLENCKEGEKTIYYLSGDDPEKIKNSPQIEGFLSKGIDVLLFTDTVDDFWVNVNGNYKGIDIKSVTRSNIDIENKDDKPSDANQDDKDEKSKEDDDKLTSYFQSVLGNLVKGVKVSKKLTSSPACLAVSDGSMDIRMERFLIEQKQLAAASAKIFEINPNHKIIKRIFKNMTDKNKEEENSQLVCLLYDQACIIEGEPVADVGAFSKRLNTILEGIAD